MKSIKFEEVMFIKLNALIDKLNELNQLGIKYYDENKLVIEKEYAKARSLLKEDDVLILDNEYTTLLDDVSHGVVYKKFYQYTSFVEYLIMHTEYDSKDIDNLERYNKKIIDDYIIYLSSSFDAYTYLLKNDNLLTRIIKFKDKCTKVV